MNSFAFVHPRIVLCGTHGVFLLTLMTARMTHAQSSSGKEKTTATAEQKAVEDINRKLNNTVIPKLEFRDASVHEMLDFLEKKGVKVIAELDGANDARITLSLNNIPLGQALRYITNLTNLKFRITARGVEIAALNHPQELVTKKWKIRRSFGFEFGPDPKAYLERMGYQFPAGATISVSADRQHLVVKNFQENIDLLDEMIAESAEPRTIHEGLPADEIRRKLNTILLPHFELRDATLREMVQALRDAAAEHDVVESGPSRKGVNVTLKLRNAPPALAARRISMSLVNVPLLEAVKNAAELSGLRLKVESYAVSLSVPREPHEVLNRETILNANLEFALGLTANSDAQTALEAHGLTFPQGTSALYDSVWKRIFMRNTAENFDRLDELIEKVRTTTNP